MASFLQLSAPVIIIIIIIMIIINFNAIIEEPEKTPNWLTTGITYLIQHQETARKLETTDPSHA